MKFSPTFISCVLSGLLAFQSIWGQQLNAKVTVNTDQIASPNIQIFKTLEKAMTDLLNNTDWTGETYAIQERIQCSFFLAVTAYESGQFEGTLQVQSNRPVYQSSYSSPIFNFNDKDIAFRYTEYEQLVFNINSADSNLVSILAYYSYLIIGLDQDSFVLNGGRQAYESAFQVMNAAQSSPYKGWTQTGNLINRNYLISDLMSGTYQPYRDALYQYHAEGLDQMYKNTKAGKNQIKQSVMGLSSLYKVRPNSLLNRVFFDAKTDEIVAIFSAGPADEGEPLKPVLDKIAPLYAAKWENLK